MIAAVAPPGSVRMPDLRRFGENQAKEQLAALGVTNIYVDYQDRARIPDLYDQYAPYAVVSTLPAPCCSAQVLLDRLHVQQLSPLVGIWWRGSSSTLCPGRRAAAEC